MFMEMHSGCTKVSLQSSKRVCCQENNEYITLFIYYQTVNVMIRFKTNHNGHKYKMVKDPSTISQLHPVLGSHSPHTTHCLRNVLGCTQ